MKINIRILLIALLIAGVMGLFVLYPFSCTDLHMKLYFHSDSAQTECTAYYTTAENPVFQDSQRITAVVKDGYADLLFPKELCGRLTGLRLDFSQTETLIAIDRMELCSAGFVQKSLDAPSFLTENTVLSTNDISVLQAVMNTVYVGTSGSDPHLYFQPDIVALCNESYSHYTGTKLAICLFLLLTVLLTRKQLFTAD